MQYHANQRRWTRTRDAASGLWSLRSVRKWNDAAFCCRPRGRAKFFVAIRAQSDIPTRKMCLDNTASKEGSLTRMLTAEIRNSRTVRALNLIFEHSSSNMDYIHVGAIWVTLAKMESGKDPTGKEILLMKLQALTRRKPQWDPKRARQKSSTKHWMLSGCCAKLSRNPWML